ITKLDVSPCYEIEGVALVITAQDVPGELDIGPILPGDPLLADGVVEYVGQAIFAVAAKDLVTARKAAMAAIVEYEDLPAVLTVEEALAKQHFITDSHTQRRGDSAAGLSKAPHVIEG